MVIIIKRIALCGFAMACMLLFSGCAVFSDSSEQSEPAASKRDNIPFSEHHSYAVAYLGYQEITELDYYVEQYLDSDALPVHYLSSGDYYLVIPRYSGMKLSLCQNDIETGESVLIFQDPDCRPFIIQCNASDIFPDAAILLSYNGEDIEFSPFISLRDGSVDIGANGLNITKADTSAG